MLALCRAIALASLTADDECSIDLLPSAYAALARSERARVLSLPRHSRGARLARESLVILGELTRATDGRSTAPGLAFACLPRGAPTVPPAEPPSWAGRAASVLSALGARTMARAASGSDASTLAELARRVPPALREAFLSACRKATSPEDAVRSLRIVALASEHAEAGEIAARVGICRLAWALDGDGGRAMAVQALLHSTRDRALMSSFLPAAWFSAGGTGPLEEALMAQDLEDLR